MAPISVIIPTRDRLTLVQQAIESILSNGNESLQAEIILIDDSATDETRALAERYPVRYLRGPGAGVSAARNVGLRTATGAYITFLDDDDTWPAHNLTRQIALLDESPQYGAVCSQVVLTDEGGTITSPPYPNPPFASGWMFDAFLSYIPQVASLLVRREVALSVGDFDPELQGGEDWDWALRLARTYQIGFAPTVAVHWRMHTTARFDGAAARPVDDIAWRRYTDVMDVARRHLGQSQGLGWAKRQRALLKQKGHYIPLFTQYGMAYAHNGKYRRAARCYWRAVRISPLHMLSHAAKTLLRQVRRVR